MAPTDDNGPTIGSSDHANGAPRPSSTHVGTHVPNPVSANHLPGAMMIAPTDDDGPTMGSSDRAIGAPQPSSTSVDTHVPNPVTEETTVMVQSKLNLEGTADLSRSLLGEFEDENNIHNYKVELDNLKSTGVTLHDSFVREKHHYMIAMDCTSSHEERRLAYSKWQLHHRECIKQRKILRQAEAKWATAT